LGRQDPNVLWANAEQARKRHPDWFAKTGDPDEVTYLKRRSPGDHLDFGVSRGSPAGSEYELLKTIAGIGQARKVDVVLHGHIHRFCDFRLGHVGGEVAYYMDFYTGNFAHY